MIRIALIAALIGASMTLGSAAARAFLKHLDWQWRHNRGEFFALTLVALALIIFYRFGPSLWRFARSLPRWVYALPLITLLIIIAQTIFNPPLANHTTTAFDLTDEGLKSTIDLMRNGH
jgi:hypothetical protein